MVLGITPDPVPPTPANSTIQLFFIYRVLYLYLAMTLLIC